MVVDTATAPELNYEQVQKILVARYDIDAQNAVLVVVDGQRNRLQFSSTAWLSIEDKPSPQAS